MMLRKLINYLNNLAKLTGITRRGHAIVAFCSAKVARSKVLLRDAAFAERKATMKIEQLESRQLLAGDLYTLQSRPGLPGPVGGLATDDVAINETYAVVGRTFGGYSEPQDGFYGEVHIHSAADGTFLRTLVNPDPELIYHFGDSVAIYGNLVVVGSTGYGFIDEESELGPFGDLSGRAYVYNADTGELLHRLLPSYNEPGFDLRLDKFGTSVDIYGDTIVVGAPSAAPFDMTDYNGGHVLVYSASSGELLRTIFNPANPDINDGTFYAFGETVSIDGTTLVVSDPSIPVANGSNIHFGRAYVFDVTTGGLQHTLLSPTESNNSVFGFGLDISGDKIVASLDGITPSNGGPSIANASVLVFNAITGDHERTISNAGNDTTGNVSLSGNAVAVRYAQMTGTNPRDLAKVYDVRDGSLIDTVVAPINTNYSNRGSLELFQDRLLVSHFDNASADKLAFAYVIESNDNQAPTDITLSNNQVDPTAAFGTVIGVFDAIDPDPTDTANFTLLDNAGGRFNLTGSILTVSNASLLNTAQSHTITVQATDSGGLTFSKNFVIQVVSPPTDLELVDSYVVEGSANGTPVGIINDPNPMSLESFASSVMSFGGRTAFANKTNTVGNFSDVGTVYIRNDATGKIELTLSPDDPEIANFFGRSVAFNDDYIVVGCLRRQNLGSNYTGSIFIFDATTGAKLNELIIFSGSFGESVALHGQTIAVGALGATRVLVFDANTPIQITSIQNPDPNSGNFGEKIAFSPSGQLIVSNSTFEGEGRAYVFSAGSYSLEQTLFNPSPSSAVGLDDRFGAELAVYGNTVLVGAWGQDTGGVNDSGAVYQFNLLNGQLIKTLVDPNPNVNGYFGSTMQTSATDFAIGGGAGQVYLYGGLNGLLKKTFSVGPNMSISDISLNDDGLVVGYNNGPTNYAGEARIFDLETGLPLSTFRVSDDTPTASNTFALLNNAGGRFAIVGNQLVVANGALIDAEQATSYTIEVQVTDDTGLSFSKSFQIKVIGTSDTAPTDITIDSATVPESSVRYLHNTNPDKSFGGFVSTSGNLVAVSLLDKNFPQTTTNQVEIYNATTGELLRTLVNPSPTPNASGLDGQFGNKILLNGNTAIISAPLSNVESVQNAGQAFVFDVASGNLIHTLTSPNATSDDRFGQSLAVSSTLIVVSALDDVGAEQAGSVYLFNPVSGAQVASIHNPSPAEFDSFGQSVGVVGQRLVISSPGDDFGQQDAGRAYIYQTNLAAATGTLIHTLNNPTPEPGDFFGTSVAISDSFVAVSAPSDNTGAENAGQVYIFSISNGTLLRTIANPTPVLNDRFGDRVKITGNYLIVSSENASGVTKVGQLHVFDMRTGQLLAELDNPTPASNDLFGIGSAVDNVSVDGTRLVIGASGDDLDGSEHGLVYIYDLAYGQTIGTLNTIDPDASDTFTYTLTDDANGRFAIDGSKLIVADANRLNFEVGTTHNVTVQVTDASGATTSKVISISVTNVAEPPKNVQLNNGGLSKGATRFLHNPAVAKNLSYGYVTAADGNLIVVGTNNLTNNPGEVYVFSATNGNLVSTMVSPTPQNGEVFGERVAISGNRVLVTSRLKDIGPTSNVGQAYLFDATTGALLHTLNHPTPSANTQFGNDIAIDGNLVVIASQTSLYLFNANTGSLLQTLSSFGSSIQSVAITGNTIAVGTLNGAALTFEFNVATQLAAPALTLNNPNQTTDFYGRDVTVQGTVIAVSAPFTDFGATDSGSVYLFDRVSGNLLRTIHNPSPAAGDNFGFHLAISGNVLAVSAQFDDTGAANSGQVYLFDVATGALLNTVSNPSPNTGDLFSRLSFAGDKLVVGSSLDDTDGDNTGMVYVFDFGIGQVAGNLASTDPDAGNSINYTLVDSAGGRFALQGNTPVVANGALIAADNQSSYAIVVRATDSTGLYVDDLITIPVTIGVQPPTNITFVGNAVVERAANLTVVSTMSTADANVGDTFTYTLINSAGGRFGIVGNQVIVNNGVAIDFETSPAHTIIVQVTDASGLSTFESFRINVTDAPETFDFGDLPASFGTTLASNGARHEVFAGSPRLGASVTIDNDGQPNASATADIFDDGVVMPALLIPNLNAVFTVTASHVGRLDAFIDFGGNGNFSESERITPINGLPLVAGANTFTTAIPATAASGSRGVRFRYSTVGGLGPTGVAADGEVEDYRIDVLAPANLSSQLLPDPENPGQTLMFVRGSSLNDIIAVDPVGLGLRATINGIQGATLAAPNRIVMFGVSGNDDLRINTTTIPGFIDGGLGDDTIRGGNGPDLLFGRAGNDIIFGRGGVDLIYGSSGNDQLFSDSGAGILFGEGNDDILVGTGILVGGDGVDTLTGTGSRNLLIGGNNGDNLTGANVDQGDILIAGYTTYDANVDALYALHNEWRFNAPVLERIAHLNGTTPGGLNGSFRLDESTVFVENQVDTITNFGTSSALRDDWVFVSAGDVKVNPPGIVVVIDGVMNGSPEGTWPEILGVYTNYGTPADVNFDDIVTPLDALLLIDGLNRRLRGPVAKFPPGEELYYDVNDDLQISPLDVLMVIDQLNRRTAQQVNGEGEASPMQAAHDIALAELAVDMDFTLISKTKRGDVATSRAHPKSLAL